MIKHDKVFIVEDSKSTNEYIAETLIKHNYKTYSAFSGAQALELFKSGGIANG